jgi:hypothetical protein
MRTIFILLSILGLLLTIVPSLLVFAGLMEFSMHTTLMVAGTAVWFITAPLWIKKQKSI